MLPAVVYLHSRAPFSSPRAYKLRSWDVRYTTPSASVGAASIHDPVLNVHRMAPGAGVGVGVGVSVGVGVGVVVGDGVGDRVTVAVGSGGGVWVGVALGAGLAVGRGDGVGVAGAGDGVGKGVTADSRRAGRGATIAAATEVGLVIWVGDAV